MQVNREQINQTRTKLTITAEPAELERIKQHVIKEFGKSVKVPGFREGKAPANLIEKQADQNLLQAEFLEHAINDLYADAVAQTGLRPIVQPEVNVIKFVPFSTLEFTAEVEAIGDIKLADYKNIKLPKPDTKVTADEVNTVLGNLRQRSAERQTVERPAKQGDEVVIDFKGTDAKTKQSIEGADGKAYPLVLGSQSFIPGFEDELIGLKPGDSKDFQITFPKDYGVADLQGRQVNFNVKVHKVSQLNEPKLDDAFAATAGPFKTLAELEADIKKQLEVEKLQEAQRTFDNELLQKIADKSTAAIPAALVEEEIERMEAEEKRNLVYRGQTWQEHLEAEGISAEQHREKQRPGAELRVKGGLVLGEIAQREAVTVTPEELEIRVQLLKGQYPDPAMQAELDKHENRRDIMSRLMTEKTLDKLRAYATTKD